MTLRTLEATAMTSPCNPHAFLFLDEAYNDLTPPPPFLGATTSNHRCLERRLEADAAAAAAIPPCIECGKRFSSSKALYGHMRCHPERPYRGMNPRAHFGRPLLLGSPGAARDFTDDEYEVARSLVMLASGPQAIRWPPPGSRFACPSCPRVFGSHQAVARHRSSHRARAGGKERGRAAAAGKKRTWEEAMVLATTVGSCSSANYVWDLNLPPPLDEGSPVNNPSPPPPPALDLKLGI